MKGKQGMKSYKLLIYHFGKVESEIVCATLAELKDEFLKHEERFDIYPQCVIDGKALTIGQALKKFKKDRG